MRRAAFVSESAQWTTTSWTLHFPAPGRHESAAFGTLASASRIRSGPRAYCSMSASRSSRLMAMALPPPSCRQDLSFVAPSGQSDTG